MNHEELEVQPVSDNFVSQTAMRGIREAQLFVATFDLKCIIDYNRSICRIYSSIWVVLWQPQIDILIHVMRSDRDIYLLFMVFKHVTVGQKTLKKQTKNKKDKKQKFEDKNTNKIVNKVIIII